MAEPGQTVAIVGPTGAGKTTLVNLMMRFYEIDAGRITLDGVDVTSVPRRELRSRLGMVLQDTWLFGGTIRDNINGAILASTALVGAYESLRPTPAATLRDGPPPSRARTSLTTADARGN